MNGSSVRRAFGLMHVTLGLVILSDSLRTVVLALPGSAHPSVHLVILALVEATGALLFLVPAWTRLGGGILLTTFVLAFAAHAVSGELQTTLLVYAATTVFVMVHGPLRAGSAPDHLSTARA